LIVLVVVVGFYFLWLPVSVLADSGSIQESALAAPTVIPDRQLFSETQNDITVELNSARVIATGLEVGICYTAPDDGEWRPLPGRLVYGTSRIPPDEIEFFPDEKLADGKSAGWRCAAVRYAIDDLSTLSAPIEFSILRFYAPGRELYSACQELQQRLDTSLKAQAYGLKMSCKTGADGSAQVSLLEHAASVSTAEAQEALDRIASAEVPGTWKFTITDFKK